MLNSVQQETIVHALTGRGEEHQLSLCHSRLCSESAQDSTVLVMDAFAPADIVCENLGFSGDRDDRQSSAISKAAAWSPRQRWAGCRCRTVVWASAAPSGWADRAEGAVSGTGLHAVGPDFLPPLNNRGGRETSFWRRVKLC